GDEFVVLAAVNGPHGTRRALARLAYTLAERNETGDLPFTVSASVGWARARQGGGDDLVSLLARADRSMYRRKRARQGVRATAPAPGPAPAPAAPVQLSLLPARPPQVA